jgi:hypothetical protein
MTTTELERVPLPVTAAPSAWTPQQGALMAFVGLAIKTEQGFILKPNAVAVAEAFLHVCRQTGLDPFVKQIYAMETRQGYAIVTGVDGFRVIAQRSKGYRGQIGPQWFTGRRVRQPLIVGGAPVFNPAGEIVMTEQDEWVDAWTPEALGLPPIEVEIKGKSEKVPARPVAARVGVLREGFAEPLWQVVTWEEFGVEPRFPGDNWLVRPAHMLGIRAETHGLRRTFPNDLSGIYTPEDFDDDETAVAEQVGAQIKRIEQIDDLRELERVYHELNAVGMPDSVRATIMTRAGILKSDANGADASATGVTADENGAEAQSPTETPEPVRSARTASEPEPKARAEEPDDAEFALEVPEGDTGALSEEEFERAEVARHEAELAAREEGDR